MSAIDKTRAFAGVDRKYVFPYFSGLGFIILALFFLLSGDSVK